jgi:hypothetical protein
MQDTTDKAPFIRTQGMRLLAETDRPERFLRAEYFRAGRGVSPATAREDLGTWLGVDRLDVAYNRLVDADGSPCDASRLAITTDAGVGKTTAMGWLHAELNQPGSGVIAFLLNFGQLTSRPGDLIRETLLAEFQRAEGNQASQLQAERAAEMLDRLRAEGRVVLLVDALDQAPPDGSAVRALRAILEDPDWKACRIVVSGRPYALQRHWREVFDGQHGFGWRFLQLDEFDERQQRQFLGSDRFDLIPREARDILGTPRVLEYLRALSDEELKQIKTTGDVYWHSINHLLKLGMKNSEKARQLGLAAGEPPPPDVQARSVARARKLLGAIAFQMTATLVRRTGATEDSAEMVPNFDGVRPGEFERFKDQLFGRLGDQDRQLLERDVDSLAALNDFVSHGIFDTDVVGLDRILWRNRTLQEFFAAFWLAQHCWAPDAALLWDWIYLPEVPATEEYYDATFSASAAGSAACNAATPPAAHHPRRSARGWSAGWDTPGTPPHTVWSDACSRGIPSSGLENLDSAFLARARLRRAREGKKGKKTKIFNEEPWPRENRHCRQRARRSPVVAVRGASAPRKVAPRAATQHTGGTEVIRVFRVGRAVMVPRIAPFPNVAVHVEKAPGVGLIRADRRGSIEVRAFFRAAIGRFPVEVRLL